MAQHRILAVFDFDETIVEESSDAVVRKLINPDLIHEDLQRLYNSRDWIDYMVEICKLMYKSKVSQKTISEAMHAIAPTSKMLELLHWFRDEGHETIIISDSNSVFIDEWLKYNSLLDCVAQVFTNPASFDDKGHLMIQPYHSQDWCQLSPRNLCKGYILQMYIGKRLREGVIFDTVAYTGDGQNDFCPCLKLTKNNFVFPRAGFALEKMINDPDEKEKVVAAVHPWTSAAEIKSILQNRLKTPKQ